MLGLLWSAPAAGLLGLRLVNWLASTSKVLVIASFISFCALTSESEAKAIDALVGRLFFL
jgi:hypothetical protein